MINAIFWDLDENLLHSLFPTQDVRGQNYLSIELKDGEILYTIVRPCANKVIEYSRSLVGAENVYILTSAVREYALQINEKAGFRFTPDKVFAREDHAPVRMGYGYSYLTHPKWSKDNLLIDNLPYEVNQTKVNFIGNIPKENYLKTRDYYGVNFPGDPFEENIYKFLDERMK